MWDKSFTGYDTEKIIWDDLILTKYGYYYCKGFTLIQEIVF